MILRSPNSTAFILFLFLFIDNQNHSATFDSVICWFWLISGKTREKIFYKNKKTRNQVNDSHSCVGGVQSTTLTRQMSRVAHSARRTCGEDACREKTIILKWAQNFRKILSLSSVHINMPKKSFSNIYQVATCNTTGIWTRRKQNYFEMGAKIQYTVFQFVSK